MTFLSASPLARNRNFRLLFAAQVISLSGSGVTTVGLALFAHQLVGGSSAAAVIGNALMLRILAFLMFSQWPRLCRVFCTDSRLLADHLSRYRARREQTEGAIDFHLGRGRLFVDCFGRNLFQENLL